MKPDSSLVLALFRSVRAQTIRLCEPLEVEDTCVQPSAEASPPKWHLGHTSWFYEEFLLVPGCAGYRRPLPEAPYVFNSYYEAVGPRVEKVRRGTLSRPLLREILDYRRKVDESLERWWNTLDEGMQARFNPVLLTGVHHEQQHQELLLMDIKQAFALNRAMRPVAATHAPAPTSDALSLRSAKADWVEFPAGLGSLGHWGVGFSYDNERPRHRVFLEEFRLRSTLVTNAEYVEFMEAGGYREPAHWLSDGWAAVQRNGWQAPLYWERNGNDWWQLTLSGARKVQPDEPVVHVSYYEADAFARWRGKRLPTEAEWETAALSCGTGPKIMGNFLEAGVLHPLPVFSPHCEHAPEPSVQQLLGDVWEWTASAYLPYPGYRPEAGALGEYNGKFMCNQMVLRGGSCVSPRSHLRVTYRNFYYPDQRWQFSGIRLAS